MDGIVPHLAAVAHCLLHQQFDKADGIWAETVSAFLEGLGYHVMADGRIDERNEDEKIRILCENLTARQRLKTYRQLYALGCRIDRIERHIENLNVTRG